MKRNALAISLLWFAASLIGCSKRSDQSMTAGAQQAASGTSVAVAQELSPPSRPSQLTFRGLHAGQSQAEVEAALKRLDGNASLSCDKPTGDGSVFCEMDGTVKFSVKAVGFSPDGRLFHFMFETWGDSRTGTDSVFAALRKELADSNHEGGTLEPTEGGVIGDYLAKNGVQDFTWGTDRTVLCFLDQERDDCPAEQITLSNAGNATVEFKDNAYYSEGMVKKDKTRPQPKVVADMTFMGLKSGALRSQVNSAIQRLHYPPLTCKSVEKYGGQDCATKSQDHAFDLRFYYGRLYWITFHYPASEHDKLYQTFVSSFGQPTDFAGKKGSEIFTWKSERTIPCQADEEKQCPAIALIFAPPDAAPPGKTSGTVNLMMIEVQSKGFRPSVE